VGGGGGDVPQPSKYVNGLNKFAATATIKRDFAKKIIQVKAFLCDSDEKHAIARKLV
jgi:hypothetical protein